MISHVRPAQWQQWLDQATANALPVVLDVREPWELQTASVTPIARWPACATTACAACAWQRFWRNRGLRR